MLRTRMLRALRVAALAAVAALALGSVAWGYDDDAYYSRQDAARENGHRNGYRDGFNKGEFDHDRNRRFNFKNDDWEDSRGFEHWMGSKGQYKQSYREGYERGYRRAYGDNGYRRDHDRDDYRRYDRDDWR